MSHSNTQIEPLRIHPDAYPVMRVGSESFLRGFDAMSQLGGSIVGALVFVTIWQGQVSTAGRRPMGIRQLSRKLHLPYETVRRHVRGLQMSGQCVMQDGGLVVPAAVQRSKSVMVVLRTTYLNGVRLLGDLTRIGVARFTARARPLARSGRLTKDQVVIAAWAIEILVRGMQIALDQLGGDLIKAVVFTAIWTANVKHVTNSAPASSRTILSDDLRRPVSILAISRSLRMPYETVRRHAQVLLTEGTCVRVGRHGLVIPESAHRRK